MSFAVPRRPAEGGEGWRRVRPLQRAPLLPLASVIHLPQLMTLCARAPAGLGEPTPQQADPHVSDASSWSSFCPPPRFKPLLNMSEARSGAGE